ncbi:MAG: hypothetical protein JWO94_2810, partial [Verrucomicrobiaceae bacterium]|nr:hypothetical protein [Verrucomicrobiaceae bacterium]
GASGGGNWSHTDATSTGASETLTTLANEGQLTHQPQGVLGVLSRAITGVVGATAGTAVTAVRGSSASGNLAASSSPDFQLIPLNNDMVAKQFLEPISTDVFFTLYQQGLPMDQLLRVLVERIETTLPDGENLTLVNSPTSGTPKSYARFLRAGAILREMQRSGDLLMDTKRDVKVLGVVEKARITGKDIMAAQDKKLSYQNNADGSANIVQEVQTPTFYLRPGTLPNVKTQLYAANVTDDHIAIDHVVEMLSRGIVIKNKADADHGSYSRLVLRSYSRAMEAAATEQDGFDALMHNAEFKSIVPVSEQRPILRTIWTGPQPKLREPLQVVHYAGQTYEVTDPVAPALDPAVRWNRDVFRLLVELGSQVSVDISKFQRQVLELR